MAMSRGDYRFADRLGDESLAAIERRHGETKGFLDRLLALPKAGLEEVDLVNYELFELELRTEIEGHQFRSFLAPIAGRFGPQQQIPQMHERVRFQVEEDWHNYVARLEQVPKLVDDTIEKLKLGLSEGRTAPQITMAGLDGQFDSILKGGLDPLITPMQRMPVSIPAETQRALSERFVRQTLPQIKAAMTQLREYVVNEYLPHCRQSTAAIDWPDGEAYYNFQLRRFTTTNLTAKEIHEIGLSEVARIRAEMSQVIQRSDFMHKHNGAAALNDADRFRTFIHYLRTDPRFYHESEEALLAGYRDICKRVDALLPGLFRTLPRLPYGVRAIPKFMAPTQTTAYYQSGDIRNGEAGYFYANTYALDQRPKYEMIPLAIHEAVPGHHLQIALAQELEGLPQFRKDAYFVAFGEGWALYSERLGIEMGFFQDPYDDFGRLLYEMWRACRLVVDPGMHALGWSREQAIQFMLDNTALSPLNIETEVDRYIAWPGQATGYKIGELKIRELRARAEQSLGKSFDLRAFHEVVLGAGAVPLTILERRVNDWIARGGG